MIRSAFALALVVFSRAVAAEHEEMPLARVDVGTTLVASATSADELQGAGVVVFDIAFDMPVRNGRFSLLIDAETDPGSVARSAYLPVSGHNAGAALDASQHQAWVTAFHYDFETDNGEWTIGFIESKGYIDISDVANDEKTQFSSPVFVNNPTIGMPAGQPGFSWRRAVRRGQPGYSVLFTANEGPGAFLALETWWDFANITARLGAWNGSADPALPPGKEATHHNHGLYAAMDGGLAEVNWNFRAGIANPGRNTSGSFISFAAEIPVAGNTLGVGAGYSTGGDHSPAGRAGGARHIEVYLRHAVTDGLVITPCIQIRDDALFSNAAGALTAGVRIRLNI